MHAVGWLRRGVVLRGSYCFADDETLGHAPPEAVPRDNLVVCPVCTPEDTYEVSCSEIVALQ